MDPPRVVVIGGGIAGLGVALGLGRAGWTVVVVDGDDLAPTDGPDRASLLPRRGAPQVHHTHGLLARLTATTRQRFPDVLDALVAAGGVEVDLADRFGDQRPGDADLRVLLARRTTLDWAFRRAAIAEPTVTLRGGERVDSLLVAGGVAGGGASDGVAGTADVAGDARDAGVAEDARVAGDARGPGAGATAVGADSNLAPVIRGVRLSSGEVLPAVAVVAAAGGRAPVAAWLAELGVEVKEERHDTGIVYLTRWYRTAVDWDPVIEGHELVKLAGDLGYLFYLAVPADKGAFSLTMAIGSTDAALRSQLLNPLAFDKAARALPLPNGLVDRLIPDGPVHPMGGLVNRIRHFADDAGQPIVLGFHAAGDAHTCTNPIYGRGCSLALVQAVALVDAFTAHPHDQAARARAYEEACRDATEPWYRISVETDRARQARYRRDGQVGDRGSPGTIDQLMRLGSNDPLVGRAILRALNLLATPEQLMNEPEVVTRVVELAAERAAARADDGGGPASGPGGGSRSGTARPGGRWARSGPTRQEMIDLTAA